MCDIQKITDEKFDEIKNIVNDSDAKIREFDKSKGIFRVATDNSKISFEIIETELLNMYRVTWHIAQDNMTVYDITVGLEQIDYGVTEFHKILNGGDNE